MSSWDASRKSLDVCPSREERNCSAWKGPGMSAQLAGLSALSADTRPVHEQHVLDSGTASVY